MAVKQVSIDTPSNQLLPIYPVMEKPEQNRFYTLLQMDAGK